MAARRQTPSLLELCDIFKKRNEEFMTSQSKDSELGGSPCYRRVTGRIKEQEEEERATVIQTDKDMSWHSRPSRSTHCYESRASPESKEERFRYVETRNESRFSMVETGSEFYYSDDSETESSLDEEYSTEPVQAREGFVKVRNVHATRLYRPVHNEITQPRRDQRRIYRTHKQLPEERRKYAQDSSQQAATKTESFWYNSGARQFQKQDGRLYKPAHDEINQPQRDERRTYREQMPRERNVTRGCSPQEMILRVSAESSSDEEYSTRAGSIQAHDGSMKARNVQPARLYSPVCDQIIQPHRDERETDDREQMLQERINTRHPQRIAREQCQGYCQYPADTQGYSQNQANGQGGPRYPHDHEDSLEYSNTEARTPGRYPHRDQHQERKGKRVSCQTTKLPELHVCLKQKMQLKEEGSPPGTRNECGNRETTKLPPIQQSNKGARNMEAPQVLPRQIRIEDHQNCQALLTMRRSGRQEVLEGRDKRAARRRRIGVCQVTDGTQEQRIFVRVLGKRF